MTESNFSIDRSKFEKRDEHVPHYVATPGLNEELIRKISQDKQEPDWMLTKRLRALELFKNTPMPTWGPNLSELELEKIVYYVDPDAEESENWEEVPEEIKETFDRLGIPQAEQDALAGAGAQYDSGMVYHHLADEWEKKGVIFENMDTALQKYPDFVKKHFMTSCVPISDHKFAMLHAAVWSGGTFIYIPPGVEVEIPLQAYFRMNQESAGQFEHTLIVADKGSKLHYIEGCSAPLYSSSSLHAGCVEIHVHENAHVKYSSIENWSRNTYNLNTKRALVHKNANIEWVNGNMGSGVTMLYPSSVLIGESSRAESIGLAFADKGQNQDTGTKVVHVAPNTSSLVKSKSVSKGGGVSTYRGIVKVLKNASNCVSSVDCDALMVDSGSVSKTYPKMEVDRQDSEITHEAKVGKVGEEEINYLMSRGMSEEEAKQMIVRGFASPVVRKLPLEYAAELNKLIEVEMEGL